MNAKKAKKLRKICQHVCKEQGDWKMMYKHVKKYHRKAP